MKPSEQIKKTQGKAEVRWYHCPGCDVQVRGDEPHCWLCGGEMVKGFGSLQWHGWRGEKRA